MPPSYKPQFKPVKRFSLNASCPQFLHPDSAYPVQFGPFELNFEHLSAFEQVRDQYAELGFKFEGAIALQPSNPAFSSNSRSVVLMPMGDGLSMSIYVYRPLRSIGARVVGIKQVRLTAYDWNGKAIGQSFTGLREYVQDYQDSVAPLPRRELELQGQGIAKVILASDAPFVVDSFVCR